MTITNNNNEEQQVIHEIMATSLDNAVYEWVLYDELPEKPPRENVLAIVGKHEPYDLYCSNGAIDGSTWICCGPLDLEENKDEWIVTSTNCPNCGAVVNKHTEECEYCGTPYAKTRVK